jgi:SulP family sulfate permease
MPELLGQGNTVYLMTAVGLGLIYGLPYLTKAVPSPLVTIVLLTGVSMYFGLGIRTVGDMGALPSELPWVALPQVPFTLETLWIILPVSLTLTMVGLLESLMTAAIVDEMTDTTSDKNRECAGQGAANIVSGFFGGMAGCAMIGQSVINVTSGGRGRLSTLLAGVFLLFLIVVLGPYVAQIPMAALVAVMIMVSLNTFQWRSARMLLTHPKSSSFVMLGTVVVVVATHDLAKGVLFGVILSGLFFAHKVTRFFKVESTRDDAAGVRTYAITGQIFFATAEAFHSAFDFREEDLKGVVIDLHASHFWDISSISALDRVVLKFRRHGIPVEVVGMNEATANMVERLGTHDKPDAILQAPGH